MGETMKSIMMEEPLNPVKMGEQWFREIEAIIGVKVADYGKYWKTRNPCDLPQGLDYDIKDSLKEKMTFHDTVVPDYVGSAIIRYLELLFEINWYMAEESFPRLRDDGREEHVFSRSALNGGLENMWRRRREAWDLVLLQVGHWRIHQ